ncbi:MAG: N-acetylmuramoyl-L-alanine amidase [Paludibacteraceae bacterium]|nr:N-acetylmuramoyl-L-alanine amidase [Paludibacteraceae bacterium]
MRKTLTIILALLCTLSMMAAKGYTVVLDAGHGGKDPGAVGKFSQEKDLNLSLVLKVGGLLKEQYPDLNIVYTRSTDVFIPLQTRADIANKNNADLFISIHTNASENKNSKGVETFILGTEKAEKNLDVAMRENAVMKLESDYKTTYQGFDPNSIDSYIMFELMQNNFMDQSLQFATQVQKHFVGHLNRSDRGVQQASFWVLLKTACPAILFEMGFISNAEEEKYLNAESTMDNMATALVNAFAAYTHRQEVKKVEKPQVSNDEPKAPKEEPAKPDTLINQNTQNIPNTPSTQEAPTSPQTYYALQVSASRAPLDASDPQLKGVACESRKVGDWYKYYAIIDTDREKVAAKQQELKQLFPDCWITKWIE